MSKKVKKLLIFAFVLAVFILAAYVWGYLLKPVRYDISTDKLKKEVKIVFISDLHNCFFGGTDQSGLWEAITASEPDIVIFGGDVIDAWSGTEYALDIMKRVHDNYPCAYAPGNHEEMRSDKKEFFSDVEALGIDVLLGKCNEIDVNGEKVRIYGVLDSLAYGSHSAQLEECYEDLDENYYNILLAHQPEQIDELLGDKSKSFDLILSGHAHGGQWRIPHILDQGLYAPDQGLFPDYTTGMYTYGDTVHIISRGLAKPPRMIFIPRIFNRPELSVIYVHGNDR
ncbi:MAG TPA: metallophosphoesterase [Ruminococcus flavefaciens]|nr:metallophosphoesterase [Ruminococcus flavefaciens]